ncbi:hypothetical protein H8R94_01645 [Roseburia sp. NSJ-9]|uniref:Uncharacterized protein n=1 Tax=Roseburia lenta TaxID=2763061 RepID=A0ABR7GD34_9FIRM|nr:hypothetical protein [Roseburia lenta]MBC5685329.1 hypothetical protein [Roseburia lenta]
MEEMKEKIIEKLDAEYECFFQDMMRTSKENLFANSGEIETKKAIQNILRNEVKTNPKFDDTALVKKMLYTDNLMESGFRYASDHPELSIKDATLKILFSL